jgi:hypothetical protein
VHMCVFVFCACECARVCVRECGSALCVSLRTCKCLNSTNIAQVICDHSCGCTSLGVG